MSEASIGPNPFEAAMERAIEVYLRAPLGGRATEETTSVYPQDNVVGLGIGNKVVGQRLTSTRCLRFYVMHKLALTGPFGRYCLPRQFAGVPTDVLDVGGPILALAGSPVCQKRLRPARPGCSVGFKLPGAPPGVGSAGTIGAFVRLVDGQYGILSNNHVLANVDQLPLGTPILQPGIADNGKIHRDRIGELRYVTEIKEGVNLDCAVAVVDSNDDVDPTFIGNEKLSSGIPIDAFEGMKVWKYGRTSQYTSGIVDSTNFAFRMNYDIVSVLRGQLISTVRSVIFRNQMTILGPGQHGSNGPFAMEGDSGAVIIDLESNRPTGLLLGGTEKIAVANHLPSVLSHLNVEVVT